MSNLNAKTVSIWLLLWSGLQVATLPAEEGKQGKASWQSEFERICGQTSVATSIEKERLTGLIRDSEKLLAELQQSEEPGAKVYVFRLEKCKSFFEYALELQDYE